MNYDEAIEYINKSCKLGLKQGLDNFNKLMKLFDNHQDKLKIIHVAGTNGKGSACTMISSVLQQAGYRVGVFTSPHLQCYNERFRINQNLISNDDFANQIFKVKQKISQLLKNENECFSFFEILTAVAFNYFYEENVDFAVIEVGLGGRLDSTNVINKSLVSVITSVSFDHMEYLGTTLKEIAEEKAGIIKKNCPVVLYSQTKEVYNIIEDFCIDKNSKLYYIENYNYNITKSDLNETIFNVKNNLFSYDNLKIHMLGEFQVNNACNVLTIIYVLRSQGICISNKAIYEGLSKSFFGGRMELISKKPFIVVDGAHNIDGTRQFNFFLKWFKKNNMGKIIIIVGILCDKQYNDMIKLISEYADEIILTKTDNNRSMGFDELNMCLNNINGKDAFIENDYKSAVDKFLKYDNNSFLFCTGSLYLIADIRKYIKEVLM